MGAVILAADDERLSLENLVQCIQKVLPDATVFSYRKIHKLKDEMHLSMIDAAFLDISMEDGDGLSLAEWLTKRYPDIKIIFTTGYAEYAVDAFQLHASGYILKPITPDKIRRELDHVDLHKVARIRFHCFGNFEAYINEQPISFLYSRTKEILAYLVDRQGAMCTNGELTGILWEDDDPQAHVSYLKNLKADLNRTLEEIGCESLILHQHGSIGISLKNVECDYFDLLSGKREAERLFHGEYMNQYSWAEPTASTLRDKMKGNS